MSSNPYTPPQSELTDPVRAPASALKAVLAGLAVDLGGSLAVGVVLGIVYAVVLARQGVEPDKLAAAMNNIPAGSWVSIVGTLGGGAFSILGGYTCARMSGRTDYKLAFILAGICVTIGLLLSYQSHSLIYNGLLAALTLGAVMLGTRLGITEK